MHRFFAPTLDPGDDSIVLPREEAEHLTRVLRLGVGDAVAVFDGRGREYLGRVSGVAGRDVSIAILRAIQAVAESAVAVTLAQAVLKSDRMDDVVRDAVMIGAAAIQPLVTRRTEVTVAALARSARVDRWRRVALASAKQAGRAVLPEIRQPLTLEAYLDEPLPAVSLMFVEPESDAPTTSLRPLQSAPRPPEAAVLVGPEGGWQSGEWQAAVAKGIRLVTLGHRTLRADAVAVAALSVLGFVWGES